MILGRWMMIYDDVNQLFRTFPTGHLDIRPLLKSNTWMGNCWCNQMPCRFLHSRPLLTINKAISDEASRRQVLPCRSSQAFLDHPAFQAYRQGLGCPHASMRSALLTFGRSSGWVVHVCMYSVCVCHFRSKYLLTRTYDIYVFHASLEVSSQAHSCSYPLPCAVCPFSIAFSFKSLSSLVNE